MSIKIDTHPATAVTIINDKVEKGLFIVSIQTLSFFTENQKISCGYATPRIQEIYACLNRYRGL